MTPDEIEQLFTRSEGIVLPDDAGDDDAGDDGQREPVLTEEEKQYRVAHLRAVLLEAHNAWVSGSEVLDRIAEKLGDGSRHPLWRAPIGISGILNFFLGILPTPGLRPLLRSHALRLIGNSCADTDENRARVVESGRIHAIIELLSEDSLLPFVIPVLYNVLVDYEPVQLQACEAGLSQRLMEILGGPRLEACRLYLNLICKILTLLITQEPESRNGPPATPLILLSVATNRQHPVDMEDFSGLVAVALAYLTHESFQTYILAGLPLLLTAFSMSYTHFDPGQASDPDDAAQLRAVRQSFVPILADISALPGFVPGSAQGGPELLSHPVFQTLQSWLHGPPAHASLQTAACLALGNLARSDATCVTLVRDAQIHQPLVGLLVRCTGGGGGDGGNSGGGDTPLSPSSNNTNNNSNNAQLTHAVLSFLKNLAIPAANKPHLGGGLLGCPALPKLWSAWGDGQPQAQFAAVSLTRLLLVGCPANARRLCAPLSPDPGSPAHDRSNLHVLTALFGRSDAEPTKTEVARAVATVCRILHSSPVSDVLPEDHPPPPPPSHDQSAKRPRHDRAPAGAAGGDSTVHVDTTAAFTTTTSPASSDPTTAAAATQTRRARFYAAHHDLAAPLAFLVTQSKFPALRSEAWFVLALMCRSADGARVVQTALQSFEACRALVEAVTGRDMADGHDLLLAATAGAGGIPPPADGGTDGDQQHYNGNGNNDNGSDTAPQLGGLSSLPPLEPQHVDPAVQAGMARIDRENGLCMVAELVRGPRAADLPPLRRNIYEQLLLTGGELVLHARSSRGGDDVGAGVGAHPLASPSSSSGQRQQQQQQQQQIQIQQMPGTNIPGMGIGVELGTGLGMNMNMDMDMGGGDGSGWNGQ